MVLVKINGNFIDAEPMKNKIGGSMIKAYLSLWECLTTAGIEQSTTHIMDNKASAEYKKIIHKTAQSNWNHLTITTQPPRKSYTNIEEPFNSNPCRSR
jgi:hypothetical protein